MGLLAITLFLSHWWQRQRVVRGMLTRTLIGGVYGLALVVLLFCWLQPLTSAGAWVAVASLLAVTVTVYGLATLLWVLAIAGQLLLVASACDFLERLVRDDGSWLMSLGPVIALIGLGMGVSRWLARRSEPTSVLEPVALISRIYLWSALTLAVLWVFQYIPVRHQVWVLALAGGFLFVPGLRRSNRDVVMASAICSTLSLCVWWVFQTGTLSGYVPSLMSIVLIMGEQQWARRHTEAFVFPERVYRRAGLGLLGLALVRVMMLDAWKLTIVYRMFSFLALGLVLLALGFIYTRYQDRLKQWL